MIIASNVLDRKFIASYSKLFKREADWRHDLYSHRWRVSCLATVIDLYSKKIVGYSMQQRLTK